MLLPPALTWAAIAAPCHVLVGVIVPADGGHPLHVKPRPLQVRHGSFGLGVGF